MAEYPPSEISSDRVEEYLEKFLEPCPYLPNKEALIEIRQFETPDYADYEASLADGWRRSGPILYRYQCDNCAQCIPIRLDLQRFRPSRSQKRCLRVNSDLCTPRVEARYASSHFDLYKKYCIARHGSPEEEVTEQSYREFLVFPHSTVIEYRLPNGGKLIGVSYIDELPNGLSSIYFIFDPEYSRRSLGTFSVLAECELARELGKRYYYLGFWVPGCRKMAYKSSFSPFEIATTGLKRELGALGPSDQTWKSFDSSDSALDWLGNSASRKGIRSR